MKTRNERRQQRLERAYTGLILAFVVLAVLDWVALLNALAVTAW